MIAEDFRVAKIDGLRTSARRVLGASDVDDGRTRALAIEARETLHFRVAVEVAM